MDPEPVHAYNAALQCISRKLQTCNQPHFVQESAENTSLEDGSKLQRVDHVGNYTGTKTKQLCGSQILILNKDASDFNPDPRQLYLSWDYTELLPFSEDEPFLPPSKGGGETLCTTPTSTSDETSIDTIDDEYVTVYYRFTEEEKEQEQEGRKIKGRSQ